MDGDMLRCIDTDAHLIAFDAKNSKLDVIANGEGFADTAA
jgi:hypothetical protein